MAAQDASMIAAAEHSSCLCRGLVLQGLGRHEDALADFDAALALEPDNMASLGHRGACLRAKGQLAAAAADFERVLASAPTDLAALSNRGCATQSRSSMWQLSIRVVAIMATTGCVQVSAPQGW